ncbi:uncharacterized protein SCHCODRAFT_02603914 [Schizophyllum commune H4-8]|uniref:Uncharacterized protein n=1 Tax=Schizophyllum commune (strain H4-8 / FGSC 9210) TaxID=578458 RepID=D8PUR9_SCHCM|nr:uncharacterized protein SCHCODRAFT_02603914 [Schizophyllum commune H4-8]KAI5898992.1 hypothetical protein SCHCODRAFT_02603914 [Schizophyllum commune H4-8]
MSSSSSASSSRSSSPEPIIKNAKGKGNAGGAKNEGSDANWALELPAGAVAIDNASVSVGEFDWDAVNADPDNEVWLIRIPEGVKPKHLEGAVMSASSLSKSSRTSKVGSLWRKHTTYDIWSLAETDDAENADPEEAASTPVGGEELRALSCLLPRRKRKGDLYLAPKPIARHLVLSAREVQPTAPQSAIPLQNPPRQSYPEEMLTHKFMPYGSLVATGDDEDVAMDEPSAEEPAPASVDEGSHKKKEKKHKKETKGSKAEDAKAQKRKSEDDDAPKKSKKKKVA